MGVTQNVTAVTGTHLTGMSNSDVKGLRIDADITFIPRRIEDFFPNLVILDFEASDIDSLVGDELDPFPGLVFFAIFKSRALERIPGNLFSQTRNLKELWLDQNNIKYVGEGLLDGLQYLGWADFADNYCVNINAHYPSQFPALIETLQNNCTDVDYVPPPSPPSATTSVPLNTPTQPTTPEPPSSSPCGNTNEVICSLQEENQILIENSEAIIAHNDELIASNAVLLIKVANLTVEISEIDLKVESLIEKNENLEEKVENLVELNEEIVASNEELKESIELMKTKNTEMDEKLDLIIEKVHIILVWLGLDQR